ncbi:MAG: choice-of-anchor D domain-containing protein [Bryobacteraceae bacterium]|nr:choice-of-anchor D domain-containing protein [Bryobacteraceae bacterium]
MKRRPFLSSVLTAALLLLCQALATRAQDAENVRAWGWTALGQLGIGMDDESDFERTPGPVANLTGAVSIAGGEAHSVALRNDGTVWTWGGNAQHQLGRAGQSGILPAPVTELSGMVAIAAGAWHSLALKNDGTVWAWGSDSQSQGLRTPVRNLASVAAISAGAHHSLALKSDGTVWAWGDNSSGQLGDGQGGGVSKSADPVPVVNLTGVTAIAAGVNHSLALRSDGTVWAWGDNQSGQLGDGAGGHYVYSVTPVKVLSLTGIVAIAAGDRHSLALKSNGSVWAWGDNYHGQLGIGGNSNSATPVALAKIAGVVKIAAGASFSVALKSNGEVWTWGANEYGQLGNGSAIDSNVPVAVLTGAFSIGVGYHHAMALKATGVAWAWGSNWAGQLGNGRALFIPEPVVPIGITKAVAVGAGKYCSAAVTSDGTVWAWGFDQSDICGGVAAKRSMPVAMSGLTGIIAVALGDSHRLALKDDGTVWGWGNNSWGQLGNGAMSWRVDVPVKTTGLANVVAVAAGAKHSLALKSDGTVWAWGNNESGQLGGNYGYQMAVPIRIANLSGAVAIAAGAAHCVALTSDGSVWGWGENSSGQLGNGRNEDTTVPVAASNFNGAVAIAAGKDQTIALKSDGNVWRWGNFQTNVPAVFPGLSGIVAIAAGSGSYLALRHDGTTWSPGYDGSPPRMEAQFSNAVAVATGQSHSLALLVTGVPAAALQPTTIVFGVQKPGTTSFSRSVTIVNNGEATLKIRTVKLMGFNPTEFKMPSDSCTGATLMPNSSCGINVRFAPKAEGARSAAVMVRTNAPGSPHLVFLTGMALIDTPFPTVVAPNGGENIPTRSAFNIQWTASSPLPLTGFDVSYSSDGGTTFAAIPACTGLPATARNCAWTTPGAATASGRIRVLARNTAGNTAADMSDADFSIVTEKATPGVFLNGKWYLDVNGDGYFVYGTDKDYAFGWPGVTPVTGDWNGDRKKEIGVFSDGVWYLDVNGNGAWDGPAVDRAFSFGWPAVTPLTGDWNGDGKAEIGVFNDGWWYLDLNRNGIWEAGIDRQAGFGWPGVTPVLGDWNGDGKTEIGVFKDGAWYLDYNGNGVWDGISIDRAFSFGWPGVTPVIGDWNGDAKTEIGVFLDGWWYLDINGNGIWESGVDRPYGFGYPGVIPVVGDWNADGKAEVAVFDRGYYYMDIDGDGVWNPYGADRLIALFGAGVPLAGNW